MIEKFVEYLKTENISHEANDTSAYSSDASFITLGRPGLLIFPLNEAETLKIVGFAAKNKIPLTPRAMGSSTAGASVIPEGGVAVMTDRIGVVNRFGKRLGHFDIRAVTALGDEIALEELNDHKENELYARVGTAVTTTELDKFLSKHGWQTAVVPSSGWSTIGGNFSTNAGGNGTPKYGTYQHVINRLKVVASTDSGAEVRTVTDKDKIVKLGGGQGLYGIITELDVRIAPILKEEEMISAVCTCKTRDVESLGDKVGEFMIAMEKVTKPTIAEFMMADKSIFKKDDAALDNQDVQQFFQYNEGEYRFIMMYQGRREDMKELESVTGKFNDVDFTPVTAATFTTMLNLRKAATGKSPGRVALPGFEDIYVKNPKYLGKVLKKIYSITEGSLPGRPIGHQYTGGLVIHYRPQASFTTEEYAKGWALNEKLCTEICTEELQTVKRREHGLGLEIYKYATPEEREGIKTLKNEFDPAGIFQPHFLTENPTINFIGTKFTTK